MKSNVAILKLAIGVEQDIVSARQKTRQIAQFLGFENQDQARLATAVSELSRNVFQYAKSGTVEFSFQTPGTLQIRVSDAGPGIANIQKILSGEYISKTGMGLGLLGAKKLMDSFEVETKPGEGTTVTIEKSLDRPRKFTMADFGELARLLSARKIESAFEEMQQQNRELLQALEDVRATKSELAELNRELSETNRGVVALYSELDEKAASLQRANIVKTSFLSNMTHEFRTPLSSIISLTRLLSNRIDGDLSSEQEKQVGYIRQSAEGLLELVNDLLDLAKVEAGKVSIKTSEFDVSEIFGALRGVFRPLITTPHLELVIEQPDPPIDMNSDMPKISQILRNLLSNAIKFTDRGIVRLRVNLEPGDFVHFEVEDSGSGIAQEHLETIFEDFSQLSRDQKGQKGTGLGLPLSRKLAGLLGGTLRVESKLNEGSIFHLCIPRLHAGETEAVLISASTAARHPIPPVEEGSASFRVLIIDDHEASRYIVKSLINSEISAEFQEAEDGQIGLEKILKWNPDLVFLDLNMPQLDGFEVLERVRAQPQLQTLPIIVNTARSLTADEKIELETRATSILSKDLSDGHEIRRAMRSALAKAGFDYKQKEAEL